jgi:hypothetical protein
MSNRLDHHRVPYVLDGDDPVDQCRRSAQIDREESHTLDRSDPMVGYLEGSAARWDQQANELEAAHTAAHVEARSPIPSPGCPLCEARHPQLKVTREVPDL